MDRLGPLRMFVQVANYESFSKAAVATGMSRAALSTAVSQLELELGTRLFFRTTRRMQLTSDGQLLVAKARQLLDTADDLHHLFRQSPEQLAGLVTIEAPQKMVSQLLLPALGQLLKRHPNIQLHIRSGDGITDLIQDGVDCVIRVGALVCNSLVARPLGQFDLVNCISATYCAEFGTPASLADLAQHWIVAYAPSGAPVSAEFHYVDRKSPPPQARSVAMRSKVVVNSTEAYTAACLGGLGLVQVPRYSVADYLQSGVLVEVLPDLCAPALPVNLGYPQRKHRPARVQSVSDWLAELLLSYTQASGQ